MRHLLNLLISIYAVLVGLLYTLVIVISVIPFFLIHDYVITFFEWLIFSRLPEPKFIPAPEIEYYCGPFYAPYFIKKWMSKHHNMSCKLHDEGYNSQPTSRLEIDKLFLSNMLETVKQGKGTKFGAYSMYYLVRYVVGWPSWYLIKGYKALGGKLKSK
ncbi:MAG: hypothetical protein HRU18_01280 [Pseudoalteromonas sp.]|uniref:hypothetical protein n=1 Tax=Pseudoalteromonas sp. TaxID=53249 RepID=UPI001D545464|nr:hypothetical protein [Pseudoalteromonas sp.]NRA76812.1 hypothetical protein [Pseudoalteromonas sp.]